MTDKEIDEAYVAILSRRATTNVYFMEWWRETMKCPRCQEYALRYQPLIRGNDIAVNEANKSCK